MRAGAGAAPLGRFNVYNQRQDAGAGSGAAAGAAGAGAGGAFSWWRTDARNNMPAEPNQQPAPGQEKPLPTDRQASSIPQGGTSSSWWYPSQQMFWNALMRKGKGGDVEEDDMASVVATHNSLNEQTWRDVLRWESLHREECPRGPKLLRFQGRPDELSPLARLRAMLGGPEPFDRHDWWVERCGTEVRYVIDFYFKEENAGRADQFELVVRPALDSLDGALDRTKMFIYIEFAKRGWPCPISGTPGHLLSREQPGPAGAAAAAAAARPDAKA